MVGAEVAEVVGMYRDSGMADAVFAVLVPKNADRRIGELVEEVNEDDRKVRKALEEKRKSSLAKDAAMGPKMSEDVV